MLVKDAMTKHVECVQPTSTLREAARMMRDLDIGPLPVCGEDDKLAGIITDRDITIRAIAEGKDPEKTQVRDVMTPKVIYCFEDDDVSEAAHTMEQKQVRRLIVLNHDKRMVGIISLGDIAVVTHDDALAGHTLEAVSEPVGGR